MGSYDRLPFTNTRPCAGTRFLLTVPRFLFAARVFPREAPFLPPHPEPDGDHRRLHNGGLCALSEWQTCPYKLLGTPHPPPHAAQTTRLHYRAFFFSLFGSSVPWFTRQTDMTKDLSDRTSDYWAGMSWRGSSDKSVWFYPHDDLLFITSGGGDELCNQKSCWECSLRLASACNWFTCFHYCVFFTVHECVSGELVDGRAHVALARHLGL